jgi:palmitoyl-protein thioesterase
MVQPRESEWFEFYAPGQDTQILPLRNSTLYKEVRHNTAHGTRTRNTTRTRRLC